MCNERWCCGSKGSKENGENYSSRCFEYISPVDSGTFFPHFLSTVSKSVVGTVVVPITTTVVVVVVATSTGYNPLYLEENEDRGEKEGEREKE